MGLKPVLATQSLFVKAELPGIDPARANRGGGAFALGHPIDAIGPRILVTLLHLLQDKGKKPVSQRCASVAARGWPYWWNGSDRLDP
jgi:acetyl-CoA acetyltransferase